jgi:hypothetical protein
MEAKQMSRIVYLGLAILAFGLVAGCSKPATTNGGAIEGTNAAAKQSWEKPRSAEELDQLRNRLAHTQRDN